MTDRTITTVNTFPEDWGLRGETTPGGDWNAAADFATFAEAIGVVDTVTSGLGLTVSRDANNNPELDVGAGKAVVSQPTGDAKYPTDPVTTETRDDGLAFVVEPEPETAIGLVDGALNYVYLDVDTTSEDTGYIRTDTTDPPANLGTEPTLKIGVADTNDDSVSLTNRHADTDRGMTSAIAHSHKTHIPRGETKQVDADEHMQITIPFETAYSGGGRIEGDGSLLVLHV
jgi:hypothetical protein